MSIYQEVKERVTVQQAAEYLNLKRTKIEHGKHGEQYRYPCPRCESDDNHRLSVNVATGKFQCFSCGGAGNDIISLVAFINKIRQSEAAKKLHQHFCSAARASSSTEPEVVRPKVKGREGANALSLEHPVIEMLDVGDVLEAIGGGYSADLLRILIPLRDEKGALVRMMFLATTAEQVPLLDFAKPAEIRPEPKGADEMRKILRLVS